MATMDPPLWFRYEAFPEPDSPHIILDLTLNGNSQFNPFVLESCTGKDRMDSLVMLRDGKGVTLYAGFRTGA